MLIRVGELGNVYGMGPLFEFLSQFAKLNASFVNF